jgi:hypothetical protein
LINYLTAERAPWIGGKLRSGEPAEAVFQELMAGAAVIRVRFGGGTPALPRRAPAGEPDPDFYLDDPAPMFRRWMATSPTSSGTPVAGAPPGIAGHGRSHSLANTFRKAQPLISITGGRAVYPGCAHRGDNPCNFRPN